MKIKISRAIKVLEDPYFKPVGSAHPDYKDALKLGVEALKARKKCRQLGVISYVGDGSVNRAIPRCQVPLLPGETEE